MANLKPSERRFASQAALTLGILTVAAMTTGVLLLQAVGGLSGRDISANAVGPAFARAVPLLVLAEALKIGTAACHWIVVVCSARVLETGWRRAVVVSGLAGAALLAISGLAGLHSVFAGVPQIGPLASGLGFASVALTGTWTLLFVLQTRLHLARWHSLVGFSFGLLALASIPLAPLAMLVGLLSVPWWAGLAKAFMRPHG
jgi:hypothetical protein